MQIELHLSFKIYKKIKNGSLNAVFKRLLSIHPLMKIYLIKVVFKHNSLKYPKIKCVYRS